FTTAREAEITIDSENEYVTSICFAAVEKSLGCRAKTPVYALAPQEILVTGWELRSADMLIDRLARTAAKL
ncbi:hypothetical protein RUND412_002210, partial [Rhizina undulata]